MKPPCAGGIKLVNDPDAMLPRGGDMQANALLSYREGKHLAERILTEVVADEATASKTIFRSATRPRTSSSTSSNVADALLLSICKSISDVKTESHDTALNRSEGKRLPTLQKTQMLHDMVINSPSNEIEIRGKSPTRIQFA